MDSIEIEQTLLGMTLVNNNHYWKAAHLRPEDFAEPVHQRIWDAIQKLLEAGQNVTPLILRPQFEKDPALEKIGGARYIMQLAKSSLQLEEAAELAEIILTTSQKRKLELLYQSAIMELQGTQKPADLVAKIFMELEEAISESTTKEAVSDNEVLMGMVANSKPLRFYSTGLPILDTAMGGGVVAGKAYGFVAPKKSGKTALMATLAENFNQSGIKTLYVALEMGREQIMERIAAKRLNKNPIVFLKPERQTEEFKAKALAVKSAGNLFFLDYAGISFSSLKSVLLRAMRRGKYQVIIIDYWQLIGGKSSKESEREHLDAVAQWIAEFSKAYDVATITASQANQDGNTRGGEGMRLAFDQVYLMNRVECITTEGTEMHSWFDMMDTRYTQWMGVGTDIQPAFRINPKGVYFEQII